MACVVADNPESEDEQLYLTENFRSHSLYYAGEVEGGLALPFWCFVITLLVIAVHLSKAWLKRGQEISYLSISADNR